MAQRILRPLDYGDLLDELFDLYKRHFLVFFGMSAVVLLPLNVIIYALAGDAAGVVEMIIVTPIGYIIAAAATQAVSDAYLGKAPTILSSYRVLRGRVWAFIATMLLTSMLIGFGNLLCLIPGIIFAVWYAFVSQIFVLEGKAWGDARARSKELGDGHFWRIFIVLLLSQLMIGAISYALVAPATVFFTAESKAFGQAFSGSVFGLANGLSGSLTIPIQVIAFVLLYYDLRVRKEGFDIEMLAAGMAGGAEPEPASQEMAT